MDQMRRIIYDISSEIPPEKSRLTYTVEMKLWRKKVEAELAAFRKETGNPQAGFHIPSDIPE